MSDTDNDGESSTGIKIYRFHRCSVLRMRLRAACRMKNVWDVVQPPQNTSPGTVSPANTNLDSGTFARDEEPSTSPTRSESEKSLFIAFGGSYWW